MGAHAHGQDTQLQPNAQCELAEPDEPGDDNFGLTCVCVCVCVCVCTEEVWPYVSLDNIMDSVTLHSSSMFVDLVQSLRWNPSKACRLVALAADGTCAQLRPMGGEETFGQGTVLGLREYQKVRSDYSAHACLYASTYLGVTGAGCGDCSVWPSTPRLLYTYGASFISHVLCAQQ